MKYILATTKSEKGRLIFKKERVVNETYYSLKMLSEDYLPNSYYSSNPTKKWLLEHRYEIVNLGVKGNGVIYPRDYPKRDLIEKCERVLTVIEGYCREFDYALENGKLLFDLDIPYDGSTKRIGFTRKLLLKGTYEDIADEILKFKEDKKKLVDEFEPYYSEYEKCIKGARVDNINALIEEVSGRVRQLEFIGRIA